MVLERLTTEGVLVSCPTESNLDDCLVLTLYCLRIKPWHSEYLIDFYENFSRKWLCISNFESEIVLRTRSLNILFMVTAIVLRLLTVMLEKEFKGSKDPTLS